jgi:hypothetical protein
MEKRVGKRDLILLAGILAAAVLIYVVFWYTHQEAGAQVVVTVDGETYGTYDLNPSDGKAQTIEITKDKTVTNLLIIEDGKADMTQADCPDKLCVHQKAISATGETIVCLPNKVVVEIAGETEDAEFDTIAK